MTGDRALSYTVDMNMSKTKLIKKITIKRDMMQYKILHINSNTLIIKVFIFFFTINLSSCNNNDIDSKIEDCYEANDTVIYLSDLYQEDWDSVYFIGACSMEEIQNRTGVRLRWEDIGPKMLILNKNKGVIYHKEWDIPCENNLTGAVFQINNNSIINAIPREKAKFLIKKRDNKSYWVILLN